MAIRFWARVMLVCVLLCGTQAGSASVQAAPSQACGPVEGILIDAMEDAMIWESSAELGASVIEKQAIPGHSGKAVQIDYDLGSKKWAYVQIRREFNPPLDLSAGDHLRFFFRGTAANSLQVGMTSMTGMNYFATDRWHVTDTDGWAQGTWDLNDFRDGSRQPLPDRSQVRAIFISVKNIFKDKVDVSQDDVGGKGSFTVDELVYLNAASRPVPASLDGTPGGGSHIPLAADWIKARQQPGGLLKSWLEDPYPNAWLYDQAVGLLVLTDTSPDKAGLLADRLHALQNSDGSWYNDYDYQTLQPRQDKKAVGSVAWLVYALARFSRKTGSPGAYLDATDGAAWLAALQRNEDGVLKGSLPAEPGDTGAPTESNLDAWWAFAVTGHRAQADKLRDFLTGQVWDGAMGRFRASPGSLEIRLDNQTWGAAFLRAIGRDLDARRALSYARWTLATYDASETTCGFDGAGPFSVWNEGMGQYIAAGGENSAYYLEQLIKQQSGDGGMPGSPDDLSNGMVWLTTWHGVAPTAWLYFAGTGGPFQLWTAYLPLIRK